MYGDEVNDKELTEDQWNKKTFSCSLVNHCSAKVNDTSSFGEDAGVIFIPNVKKKRIECVVLHVKT